jgi:hypothetical protein
MTVAEVAEFLRINPESLYRNKALQRRIGMKRLPGVGFRAPRQVVENVVGIPQEVNA